MTYILNITISPPITNVIANQIHQEVFDKINNNPIVFTIRNIDVVITWHNNANSNNYYADVSGMYGDTAVQLHTEKIVKLIDISDYCDSICNPKLNFIVTKQLTRTIPLITPNYGTSRH